MLLNHNSFLDEVSKPQVTLRNDGYRELLLTPKCPKLTEDNKCSIFGTCERPGICGEFPFFKRGKTVFVASWCPATKEVDLSCFKDYKLV